MPDEVRLTVRREFPRPARDVLAGFEGVGTSQVCDAQNRIGALHHSVRPVTSRCRFVGPALLVITNGGFQGCAALGDIYVGLARNAGVLACVTDGMARDVAAVERVGIPVFARGTTPNSPFKNGPGAVGLPISLGGVAVAPGDVVMGDEDGVVVVPLPDAERVLRALDAVKEREARMEAWIAEGLTAPPWLDDLLATGVDWR
jgi:4-hydroxy-4-methyl-2-oxoglutarate aldolase